MYLEHFKIQQFPFSLTPNPEFYCELPSYQEALNILLVTLRSGEGFTKITGEVGTGKTLLCRLLLEQLDNHFVTAYIPNPDLTPYGLQLALAQELGLNPPQNIDRHHLLELINTKLLQLHADGKHVVLLLDEAQAMTEESLEALRLLTNLETQSAKLLQIVLFGQPELNTKLNKASLRQLKQRITFSHQLTSLKSNELHAYIHHRLAKAGYTYGNLFTAKACRLLHRGSRGLPRLINILSHKAMMVAYGRGQQIVNRKAIQRAIFDTESTQKNRQIKHYWFITMIIGAILLGAGWWYLLM